LTLAAFAAGLSWAQSQSIYQRETAAQAVIAGSRTRYDGSFALTAKSSVCGEIPKDESLTGTAVFVIEFPSDGTGNGPINSIAFGSKELVGGVTKSTVFRLNVGVVTALGGKPPAYVLNTDPVSHLAPSHFARCDPNPVPHVQQVSTQGVTPESVPAGLQSHFNLRDHGPIVGGPGAGEGLLELRLGFWQPAKRRECPRERAHGVDRPRRQRDRPREVVGRLVEPACVETRGAQSHPDGEALLFQTKDVEEHLARAGRIARLQPRQSQVPAALG